MFFSKLLFLNWLTWLLKISTDILKFWRIFEYIYVVIACTRIMNFSLYLTIQISKLPKESEGKLKLLHFGFRFIQNSWFWYVLWRLPYTLKSILNLNFIFRNFQCPPVKKERFWGSHIEVPQITFFMYLSKYIYFLVWRGFTV